MVVNYKKNNSEEELQAIIPITYVDETKLGTLSSFMDLDEISEIKFLNDGEENVTEEIKIPKEISEEAGKKDEKAKSPLEMIQRMNSQMAMCQIFPNQSQCVIPNFNLQTVQEKNQPLSKYPKNLKPSQISKLFLSRVNVVIMGKIVYYYDGICYTALTQSDMKRLIYAACHFEIDEAGSSAVLADVSNLVKLTPEKYIKNTNYGSYLWAYKNCLYDVSSSQIIANSPEYFVTNFVNEDLILDMAYPTPIFDNFLFQITNGNPALSERFLEAIGYILSNDCSGKCFFVMVGESNTGKSILGRLIQSFFDDRFLTSVDINSLSKTFALSNFIGKRLNISLDLPNEKISSVACSILKQLTGGDLITADIKYQEMVSFRNTCQLLYASNFPLKLNSRDQAFNNRTIVLPFLNKSLNRESIDVNLFDKLLLEKKGILQKAFYSHLKLILNNYQFSGGEFIGKYLVDNDVENSQQDLLVIFNTFLQKYVSLSNPDSFTFSSDIFEKFNEFLYEFGLLDIVSLNYLQFTQKFSIITGKKSIKKKRQGTQNAANGFYGIKLI